MQRLFVQKAQKLHDLYKKWGIRSANIMRLKARAGGLQPRNDLSPSLLRRLSQWVEQIAAMEDKERDIISEITSIEEKHIAMKNAKKLRRAIPQDELVQQPTRDKKRSNLWLWLLLLWLMRGKGRNSIFTLK